MLKRLEESTYHSIQKGRKGMLLVIAKLVELGIDHIVTPHFWPFDLVLINGLKVEVKYANIGVATGGRGDKHEMYAFTISESELKLLDYVILVLNSRRGYLFYIIPQNEISSFTIAFNPFSRQRSKYEKFKNRWDFLEFALDEALKKY